MLGRDSSNQKPTRNSSHRNKGCALSEDVYSVDDNSNDSITDHEDDNSLVETHNDDSATDNYDDSALEDDNNDSALDDENNNDSGTDGAESQEISNTAPNSPGSAATPLDTTKPPLQAKLSDPTGRGDGTRAPPVMRASSNPCRHRFNSSMSSPANSPEPRRRLSEFSFTEGFNRSEKEM